MLIVVALYSNIFFYFYRLTEKGSTHWLLTFISKKKLCEHVNHSQIIFFLLPDQERFSRWKIIEYDIMPYILSHNNPEHKKK